MPESPLVRALIDAADSASFGRHYGVAVADPQRAEITSELLGTLELKVTGWLPLPTSPDSAISAIYERVGGCYERAESLIGVNRVVLEHLARATVGLSDFLTALTEEEVCLYAAVLLNASNAGGERTNEVDVPALTLESDDTNPEDTNADNTGPNGTVLAEGIVYEIAEAAFCAGSGDPQGWQQHVGRALEVDPSAADLAARQALADRLERQEVRVGQVAAIANGAYRLAAAVKDGPFACPVYLLELVIRRALAEPGCVDYVDPTEVVYAATQACGLLDLSAVLLPPGWGWAVHGPLSATG